MNGFCADGRLFRLICWNSRKTGVPVSMLLCLTDVPTFSLYRVHMIPATLLGGSSQLDIEHSCTASLVSSGSDVALCIIL
jgi:hypothetical protein